jgi:hypothetical protein
MSLNRSMTAVIHGESGVGKSWLGDTAPAPRLLLDAEGGSRFTTSRKVMWNPIADPPPEPDGTWDTCVVITREFNVVRSVFQWLNSGKHGFKSVVLDSLTEIQQRCRDSVSGTNTPTERDWGTLLIQMDSLIRQFRDLTMHPTNPLECVLFLALTKDANGKWRPSLQGQIANKLPQYVDVVGYLYVTRLNETEEVETDRNGLVRRLLIAPLDNYAAKDRTDRLSQHYGSTIINPNLVEMISAVYDKKE